MRNGYILLHRQGLTTDEWKHPLRTLAWIDLCTLAAWDCRTTENGRKLDRGEIEASIEFLATRWRQNPGTVHRWLSYWKSQGQTQVRSQGSPQGLPQVLFLVNYAKYQPSPQDVSQGLPQDRPQVRSQVIERRVNQVKKETHVSRPETEALFDTLKSLCSQYGMSNTVNKRSLDVIVGRYVGKVQMKVETQHCIAWLIDKGLRTLSTQRLGNWFRKALEIQTREKNRLLERREIPGADGGVNARANADRFPEDCNAS